MDDKDYEIVSRLHRKAKELRKAISNCDPQDVDLYVELKNEYDELDIVDELIRETSHKVRMLDKKVLEIRNHVLFKTNGMVNLDDATILTIIEKAVL